jgi:hypothetical protein
MIFLKILLVLVALALITIGLLSLSIWIHVNKKGTKIWNFVNKHIIANEDDYKK